MNLQACHHALRSKTAVVENEAPVVKCILQDFHERQGCGQEPVVGLQSALLPL